MVPPWWPLLCVQHGSFRSAAGANIAVTCADERRRTIEGGRSAVSLIRGSTASRRSRHPRTSRVDEGPDDRSRGYVANTAEGN